ncbi:MAG: winged helix-turn-helix transcriptional regulator [Bacteroidota bacterium]
MKDTRRLPQSSEHEKAVCKQRYLPVRDTLDLVGGKWKLPITHALAYGPLRFKELQREVEGITARMLSKELKELELNELVKREVYATSPVTVEYSLTEYGRTLKPVVQALYNWGIKHRERILK